MAEDSHPAGARRCSRGLRLRFDFHPSGTGCFGRQRLMGGILGQTQEQALAKVKALALRTMAARLERCETIPDLAEIFSVAA